MFLLDTNICIYYMKGLFSLNERLRKVHKEDLYISEITLAELKFGVANSQAKEKNSIALQNFLSGVLILPILNSLDLYANEKARLRREGNQVDDFDLLIGTSAVANGMTLVTNNVKHFSRIEGISIEDWTKEIN